MLRPIALSLLVATFVQAQTQGRANTTLYSEGTSVENRKPVRTTRARNAGKNVRLLPTLKVLSQIELGMAREKVLSIAGNPQGRIDTGSLDEERWTYASKEGSYVKVRLEKGVVTTIQLPPSRP